MIYHYEFVIFIFLFCLEIPCPSIDSISIISNKCNGYLTCTVSPNLVLESLHLINSRKSTLFKQMSCTKSYLYLRYTCGKSC